MDEFRQRLQDALASGYELERELGGGGMSRVFVGVERALGRRVVVKVLSPELAAGVNAERFRREIQLAAQLHHPHIVPLLSAGEHGDLLYYTMPFIEGQSLRSALRDRGRMPLRDVVRMLHDVVDALAYAHARGIVHRDIKPDNILMHGAHALVTDFGVAKAISAALPLAGHTTTGMAIGTPAYMAPEQLAADPAADHRMDLYAVGLVAYELLTGGSPYATTSPAELLAAQLTRTPPPLHHAVPEVPPGLSAVIMRCLEKDPARRPASADVLLAQLDAVTTPQGGLLPAAGHASGITVPTDALASRSVGSHRRSVILAAVAGVLVAGAAAALALRDRDETRVGVTVSGAPGDALAKTVVDSAQLRATAPTVATIQPSEAGGRAQPLVITREESLAIAAAVRDRMSEEQRVSGGGAGGGPGTEARSMIVNVPTRAFAESLRAEVHRIYADSALHALEALQALARDQQIDVRALELGPPNRGSIPRTPATPPVGVAPMLPRPAEQTTRIVFTGFRTGSRQPEVAALRRTLADSVRATLARHPGWEMVDEETLRHLEHVDNAVTLGFATRSDIVVTGSITPTRGSYALRLHIIDPRTRRVRAMPPVLLDPTAAAADATRLARRVEAEVAAAVRAAAATRAETRRPGGG